ncbi:hypothetical protein N7488_009304 [Penicillium malachiteum]|nr:hypothetical protein N7488_009304 [Penicillium malachiteum]
MSRNREGDMLPLLWCTQQVDGKMVGVNGWHRQLAELVGTRDRWCGHVITKGFAVVDDSEQVQIGRFGSRRLLQVDRAMVRDVVLGRRCTWAQQSPHDDVVQLESQ